MTLANQFRVACAFAGFFILIGMIVLGCGVWNLTWSFRSANWPTAEGVIQTAKMERHTDSDGHRTYGAALSYNYQVAGVSYTSSRLAFGALSSSPGYAQGVLDRYPVGKKVLVHYAPEDAASAVLEPGFHGGAGVCFGVGTVFALVGFLMLKLFLMGKRT